MRLSKLLFFLRFRPTIKSQDGSPVDPLFEPPADPLLARPLKQFFHRPFGISEYWYRNIARYGATKRATFRLEHPQTTKCHLLYNWPLGPTLETFRRIHRDPPRRTYPSGPDPLWTSPTDSDLISTRFRPDSGFQVEIRSKSGQNQVQIRSGGRCRGGQLQRGRSGWGGSVLLGKSWPCPPF